LSTEILQPFGLASDGSVAVTTDANVQGQQHVQSLIATGPGERVMLPTYGVPLRDTVFAPDDAVAVAYLQQTVTNAMATWEPSIIVNSINVVDQAGNPTGSAAIAIDWQSAQPYNASASGALTATVLVGGTVVTNGVQA
jgi:phage baseplate assembly protein W